MITNVMMSNNLLPHTEAKEHFFDLEDPSPNIDYSNTKSSHSTGDLAEKELELALIQAEIFYCKPEQLIGSFEENPSFVIPKYKIAIILSENLNLEKKVIYHNWKVVSVDMHNINESIKNCIDYIQNQREVINEQPAHLFTFVDLFAGIGGFRIPLEALGGKCLGFSEIDKKNSNWAV
jgi:C-5 cytosine-specific DNA methylase